MTPVTNTMNTNIEVNKALHEAMGKCWHDLNAVAAVERWVIEQKGEEAYLGWLHQVVFMGDAVMNPTTGLVTASALQRATACLKALGVKG